MKKLLTIAALALCLTSCLNKRPVKCLSDGSVSYILLTQQESEKIGVGDTVLMNPGTHQAATYVGKSVVIK